MGPRLRGGDGRRATGFVASLSLLLASCGGSGGVPTATNNGGSSGGGSSSSANYSVPAQEALTTADVGKIVAQAATEAQARGMPSVIAVTDRVGNVLAVFAMNGAKTTATIPTPASGINLDAQGLTIPAAAGAVAKALTAAYLSSAGNAFTTRTASQITQEHFPPGPSGAGLESGPNSGVQFSQLPCSDLAARLGAAGPKRSPVGLALDPGGIPLYKNGVLVGAIGVMGDGVYGFDPNQSDVDQSDEEYAALAGSNGFAAPDAITADKVSVNGTTLRFLDATAANLKTNPASAPSFASVAASLGQLVAVRGYYADGATPALLAGQAYGSEASGVRAATSAEFANSDAFVLTDGSGTDRYPILAGTDAEDVAQPLSQAEVRGVLQQAFTIMTRARSQIRRPLDSRAQVSIAVVDTHGQPLGLVRSPDAPLFGADVALQKARTATFFSGTHAGSDLAASASADVHGFGAAMRGFLNDPTALTGKYAFTDRANGNLSRPFFPDGEDGRPNGPFSRPIAQFSPFSTGLQSALVIDAITAHLAYVAGTAASDIPQRCTDLPLAGTRSRVANGIQIFPGSVPIYRGSTLVGGIGVSGDGIDQDDLIAFLGVYNAGVQLGTIANAPAGIRADQIVVKLPDADVRLRYVNCPYVPFLDTSDQDACSGK